MTNAEIESKGLDCLARVRIVLIETRHPGNLGAAARAMKTMGLSDLVLVNPQCGVDGEAMARASGAVDVLERARIVATLAEALADTVLSVACTSRRRDLPHPAYTPRQAAPELLAQAARGTVAVVFGSETFGLSNEQLALCRWLLNIPANPGYASLNLGSAVQVLAYELRTNLEDSLIDLPVFESATHAEIEGVLTALTALLTERGFYNPENPRRLIPRLRRFFARTGMEKDEVAIWRGVFASLRKD